MDTNRHSQMNVYHQNGIMVTLDTMHEPKKVAIELSSSETHTHLDEE
jgi:hypothetical protein